MLGGDVVPAQLRLGLEICGAVVAAVHLAALLVGAVHADWRLTGRKI